MMAKELLQNTNTLEAEFIISELKIERYRQQSKRWNYYTSH